jgi:UPF0755 protein
MNRDSSILIQVLSIIISLAVLVSLLFVIYLITPISFEEKWKEIEIPEGSSYREGIDILKDNNIIENSMIFLLLGKITSTDRELKPGFYYLSASLSPLQIFERLIEGRTIQFSITIPEGSTLDEIKKKLLETGLIDDESWKIVYDKDFLESLNIDAPSLEGYIYPDTYNFPKGINPKLIFKIMVQRLREVFDESLMARAEELGMTENEVLTLASIIEKEAIYDWERPIISAVYHNRLKRNMKLQADPTVLYGVETKRRRIRYRDLRRVTPYNTYVIYGLPPGPIASPGIKSIKAALYPADVDYLYFVSKNNGTHHFSRTGEEHLEAVMLYQINGGKKINNGKEEVN